MNWSFIPYDNIDLFLLSMIGMIGAAALAAWYFRRKGWL
jgi:Mg2+ and Co2+ transporter CorA